jgi:predicted AAA+ superfamily ATPase
METFERFHLQVLKKRIDTEPKRFIQVLYGPRQVGKTTLVRQFLDQTELPWHYSSADGVAASDAVWISQQWEAARIKYRSNEKHSAILVIDKVQKVENWSEQVKKEWDRDRAGEFDLQVILLGSSRLLLQRGLTESLAGRYESTYMGHWSYSEMNSAFGLSADEFVWFGGYPGSATLIDDESRWKQYVRDSLIETTVSKDILMMTRVDKPALMKQLFELGCEFSGQILSYNKMLGQLHDAGNTTTLSHYLHLLDTAGLLAGLDKFSPNKIRQRASSPKFQVHNTALISAQHPESFEKLRGRPAEWGRWVESAVGAHLLNAMLNSDLKLMYWRHSNDEVDFVLKNGEKIIGIEVKSGPDKRTGGMQAFSKKFSPEKVLLVGDDGLAWQEFLELNPKELF